MALLVGDRIRARRLELGWTQDYLATRANISKGYLSDLENNKRNVGADTLLDLSEALGVSLDFLMKGELVQKPDASKPLEMPHDLAEFAVAAGISFRHARQLLGMRQQILAHRSAGKEGEEKPFDWAKFYESVKQFLRE
jgi:transcriptional regulator with XRE-family HTH domain